MFVSPSLGLRNKFQDFLRELSGVFLNHIVFDEETIFNLNDSYIIFTLSLLNEIYFVFQINMKLKPGDLLAFNNRRILHGRKEFELNGGVRYLQVNITFCYL